jgi:alkyldihydroxyacetonephosphate synthase
MNEAIAQRIIPGPPPPFDRADESPDVWGFRDSGFTVLPNGSVQLTGSRYALSGSELPDLIPWVKKVMGVEFLLTDTHDSAYPPAIPPSLRNPDLLATLQGLLPENAISSDPLVRLRHGHGHTLEEMYAIKYGRVERIPDLVVFPSTEAEVQALVEAARQHNVCLVPYGGGTNVTDALRCPPAENRSIVSVDLRRLNRILWIDPVNLMACIQAGAVGRHLQSQLAEHGFTMGHEPDSVEFSTLGGWIATHASGMKKNRYGNIEDLVLDVHVITSLGPLARPMVAPRESVGIDPRRWMFGSEGTLGIITHAVVKIFPLPEVERHDAVLFPTFEHGVAFLSDLTREAIPPASVRLVDNLQFQLSQTLKPKTTGLRALIRKAERLFVTRIKGFDPTRMVACTLLYEGGSRQVAEEEAAVRRLARRHGGMRAGADNGKRGYQLTFGIAYIRDFVMKYHILGESFETSVPWSEALALCANVKRRLAQEYTARKLPGTPFVTCRVTQVYQTGVCVYFYFGFHHKGVSDPCRVYAELERAARDEILRSGGSLSHHHGIGKLRTEFLPRVFSKAALDWSAEVKRAVDPTNIFGIANQ